MARKDFAVFFVLAIFLIGSLPNLPAPTIESTATKDYNSLTKTVTLTDASSKEILNAQLKTPQINPVVPGKDRLVAEIKVNNSQDVAKLIDTIDLFDNKTGKPLNRTITLRWKNVYGTKVISTNVTNWDNQSVFIDSKIINTTEELFDWVDFDNTKVLTPRVLTIGIFTDVERKDDVEWIPTIAGVQVAEWAKFVDIISTNLVSCWSLDETSGTNVVDSAPGQQNNGTNNNGVVIGVTSNVSTMGKAYYFNKTSTTNVSMVPSATLNISQDFSLGVVFNSTNTLDDQIAGGRINTAGYHSAFTGGTAFTKVVTTGGSTAVSGVGTGIESGKDVMMITTHSDSNSSIFVNGALNVTAASSTGTIVNSNTWSLGGTGAFVGFEGYLSEVWLLNVTLTATQASQLYDSGSMISCYDSTLKPSVVLNNPTDNKNFSTNQVTFSATPQDGDNLTGLNVTLYGNWTGSWKANATNSSAYNNTQTNFTVDGIPNGIFLWGIFVNDTENNPNWSATNRTFIVDTVAPNVSYVSPTESNASNLSRTYVQVNVTSTDAVIGINTTTIRLYNGTHSLLQTNYSLGTNYSINYTGLSDGVYWFNASVNDSLNNANSTATYKVTLDTTSPTVNITKPTGTYASITGIPYNVSLTDALTFDFCTAWVMRGASIEVANTTQVCPTGSSGDVNGTISVSGDANYVFWFWVNDSLGHANASSSNFTVSTSSGTPAGGGGGVIYQDLTQITPIKEPLCLPYKDRLMGAWSQAKLETDIFTQIKILWEAWWNYGLCVSPASIVPL